MDRFHHRALLLQRLLKRSAATGEPPSQRLLAVDAKPVLKPALSGRDAAYRGDGVSPDRVRRGGSTTRTGMESRRPRRDTRYPGARSSRPIRRVPGAARRGPGPAATGAAPAHPGRAMSMRQDRPVDHVEAFQHPQMPPVRAIFQVPVPSPLTPRSGCPATGSGVGSCHRPGRRTARPGHPPRCRDRRSVRPSRRPPARDPCASGSRGRGPCPSRPGTRTS